MTIYLLDVNMLLALSDPMHIHHEAAHRWFAATGQPAWATCPITENGFARIASHPSYPNRPGDAPAVLELLRQYCAVSGHHFWAAIDGGALRIGDNTWEEWIAMNGSSAMTTSVAASGDGANQLVFLRLRDINGVIATVVTGTVDIDTTPPSSSMPILAGTSSSAIPLSWSASDAVSGVATYDVEVRQGSTGAWTPVLTGSTATSTTFNGTPGTSYNFRVRAIDLAGNVEA